MRVLRTRYDMIALLLQTVPKAHHNYAKRIITHNSPQAIITDNSFRRWRMRSYEFRVMNLASPNVMRVLRTRYDMIAPLLQAVPKAHHNYAKRIITHNSPQAIIVDFRYAKITPTQWYQQAWESDRKRHG